MPWFGFNLNTNCVAFTNRISNRFTTTNSFTNRVSNSDSDRYDFADFDGDTNCFAYFYLFPHRYDFANSNRDSGCLSFADTNSSSNSLSDANF